MSQSLSPTVANGDMVYENLPLPVVHYPNRHGTFFAFAQDLKSTPVLCACSRRAVENLLRLCPDMGATAVGETTLRAFFPEALARKIAARTGQAAFPIRFVPGLCHRCNALTPTLRYSDEIYGDSFIQTYGWYVNQAYLRMGMMPQGQLFLSEDCPPDCQAELEAVRSVEIAFQEECARLLDMSYDARASSSQNTGAVKKMALGSVETERLVELRRCASGMRQAFKRKIENMVRREIGAFA